MFSQKKSSGVTFILIKLSRGVCVRTPLVQVGKRQIMEINSIYTRKPHTKIEGNIEIVFYIFYLI